MKAIEYQNIRMVYGDKVIIEKFNLSVEQGEFVTVIGSSGSGCLKMDAHCRTGRFYEKQVSCRTFRRPAAAGGYCPRSGSVSGYPVNG